MDMVRGAISKMARIESCTQSSLIASLEFKKKASVTYLKVLDQQFFLNFLNRFLRHIFNIVKIK